MTTVGAEEQPKTLTGGQQVLLSYAHDLMPQSTHNAPDQYRIKVEAQMPLVKAPNPFDVTHSPNPKRFRSSGNDVSGTMGLLHEMTHQEGDERAASFERALADLICLLLGNAFEALKEAGRITGKTICIVRGPLFPKLRGRLLMSGISQDIFIYFVTTEDKWFERMDLPGMQIAISPKSLNAVPEGEPTPMIPPSGIDRGTRCWMMSSKGKRAHFELVANMSRGIITDEWGKARRAEILQMAESQIVTLSEFTNQLKESLKPADDTPRTPNQATRAGRRAVGHGSNATEDGTISRRELESILMPYRKIMGRNERNELFDYLETEINNRAGKLDGVGLRTELRAMVPRHLELFDPLNNRVRLKPTRAKQVIEDLLRRAMKHPSQHEQESQRHEQYVV